jgi:hypothetical protein
VCGGICMQSSRRDENYVYFHIIRSKENKSAPLVTGSKLADNFAGPVTNGLGPDVARGPPVGLP